MEKQILFLPFAVTDESSVLTDDFLSRQLPVLLRNCLEKKRPGRGVATPLATEVDGRNVWVVHRQPWGDDVARRFAADRGYDYVVVGSVERVDPSTGDIELALRALGAGDDRLYAELSTTGNVFQVTRHSLEILSGLFGLEPEEATALFESPTVSPRAFLSYLRGLDILLSLRSPGMVLSKPGEILAPFERALELDPNLEVSLTAGLGCALQAAEEAGKDIPIEAVIAPLRRWSDQRPGDPRIYAVAAEVLIKREVYIEALVFLRRGLENVRPVNRDLLRRSGDVLVEMGRTKEALEAYRGCEHLRHEPPIVERMASLCIMLGRLDEAAQLLGTLVDEEPDRPDLWSRLALVQHRNDNIEEMWRGFARMFNPSVPPAESDLVKLNTILSELDPPPMFVDRLRDWFPPESFVVENRLLFARTLRLAGARLEAQLCLNSIRTDYLSDDNRSTLARERLNLRCEGFDEDFAALAREIVDSGAPDDVGLLEEARREEPDFWPARFLAALVRSKRGDHVAALEELAVVLDHQPDNDVAWYTRGLQLVHLGRDREAITSFEKAVAINPKEADYHTNLALACARCGDGERAYGALETVLELRPDHPDRERIKQAIDEAL